MYLYQHVLINHFRDLQIGRDGTEHIRFMFLQLMLCLQIIDHETRRLSGCFVERRRKRGNRVNVVLDDDTARMEISLFSEAFQEFRHLLVKDEIVVVTGGLRYDDFNGSWTINAKNVLHIDRVIESRAKSMILSSLGMQYLTA